jgi:hypothetical protein
VSSCASTATVRGTWKSPESSHLDLGPLALTGAMCSEGSLHDQIVKQWNFIRSYLIRDGHLFLSLTADGGTYELEPVIAGTLTQTGSSLDTQRPRTSGRGG